MANKYETGVVDSHGNREFDYIKVAADMKDVVLGKRKFSKDLYEVMSLRFTIAHYNMFGWLDYYNGNWAELAQELGYHRSYGDFLYKINQHKALDDLAGFLIEHNDTVLELAD